MRSWISLQFLLIPLILAGCSKSGPPMAEVTGTVTVDGEPAKMGSVAFFPTDGKSRQGGGPIEDGKYTAMVPLGMSKVQIRVSKVVGEQKLYNTPDSPVQPILQEVLPAKFNDDTELTYDVQPGKNEKDFDLKSR
jgi:hypothetical protein